MDCGHILSHLVFTLAPFLFLATESTLHQIVYILHYVYCQTAMQAYRYSGETWLLSLPTYLGGLGVSYLAWYDSALGGAD